MSADIIGIDNLELTVARSNNSGLAKVAFQCSADSFVDNQSSVLRINICGKNRHLRQAENVSGNSICDRADFKLTSFEHKFTTKRTSAATASNTNAENIFF